MAFIPRTKQWAQDAGLPQKPIGCSDSSSMVPGRKRGKEMRERGREEGETKGVPWVSQAVSAGFRQ